MGGGGGLESAKLIYPYMNEYIFRISVLRTQGIQLLHRPLRCIQSAWCPVVANLGSRSRSTDRKTEIPIDRRSDEIAQGYIRTLQLGEMNTE